MLKALIKKQLLELYGNYRQGKNGKRRSRKGLIAYAVLMVVLMLVLIGAFSAVSIGLGLALIPAGNAWLFFSILGLMALVMFISGSVRNALLLLILAYLISPLGLPMAAAWLLARVQDIRYAIMDAVV